MFPDDTSNIRVREPVLFQSYDISYIMNSWWTDTRLAHNGPTYSFTEKPEKYIWYPEIHIQNSVNNERVGNEVVTKVYPSGDVHVNQRYVCFPLES